MPGGDGTGPWGTGGWCTPLWRSGEITRPFGGFGGRGYGRRAFGLGGRGRGYMNMPYANREPAWSGYSDIDEKTALEDRVRALEDELKYTKGRLEGLKGGKDENSGSNK